MSLSTTTFKTKISNEEQFKHNLKYEVKKNNITLSNVLPYVVDSLEEIIMHNETQEIEVLVNDNSPFFCTDLPEISISDFLRRLIKYSKIEVSTLIVMSMYIDRYCDQCSYYISNYSVYR